MSDDPDTLDATALADRLSGPPEQVAAFLLAAAEQGAVAAQLRYGQILLDGQGVARDPAAALDWFGRAARAGDPMAMNMVGRCLEQGWGCRRDPTLAAAWFEAAALRGLDWGLYNYATLAALGDGIPQDRARALDWFERAAAQGHAKSFNMIGGFHEDGWVVPRDRERARALYRRGAEAGDFRAQFNMARLAIEDGRYAEARRWLRALAPGANAAFLGKARAWLAGHADGYVVEMATILDGV
jgi:TPR repeat protein